jgi:hypothetical protein
VVLAIDQALFQPAYFNTIAIEPVFSCKPSQSILQTKAPEIFTTPNYEACDRATPTIILYPAFVTQHEL